MRAHKVLPVESNALETLVEERAAEIEEAVPPVEVVAGFGSIKVSSMFAALLQRPAKGGSSPVLKFGKSTVCVGLDSENETCSTSKAGAAKDKSSKALLSGSHGVARAARPSKPSVARRLFRQEQSMPGREPAREATPLRRCISAGGCVTSTTTSSNTRTSSGGKYARSSAAASSAAPSARSSASSGGRPDSSSSTSSRTSSSSTTGSSLADAVQSLAQAASSTASVLSSARQQHEEALQRQREQFQLALHNMRARSVQPSAGEAAATTSPARPSLSSVAACSPHSDAISSSPYGCPQQPQQPVPSPVPAAAVESYRGVQFNIPLGCRIEDGEAPGEVLVSGPAIDVVLEFRDGGRSVALVSSNCVCTVKRMGGRILVNVLPPLAARSA